MAGIRIEVAALLILRFHFMYRIVTALYGFGSYVAIAISVSSFPTNLVVCYYSVSSIHVTNLVVVSV